jgi:RHS repeat-associated protein
MKHLRIMPTLRSATYSLAHASLTCALSLVAVATGCGGGEEGGGTYGSGNEAYGRFPTQEGMMVLDVGERGAVTRAELTELNSVWSGERADGVRRQHAQRLATGRTSADAAHNVDTVGTRRLRLGFVALGGEAVHQAVWQATQGRDTHAPIRGTVPVVQAGDTGTLSVPWRALWGCGATDERCRYVVLQAAGGMPLQPATRYQLTLDQTGNARSADAHWAVSVTTATGPQQGIDVPKLGNFQADTFSGNARAEIGFELPPGPAGTKPALGLGYSSLRANSELRYAGVNDKDAENRDILLNDIRKRISDVGRGWQLQGGGYVQGQTLVMDGVSHPLNKNGTATIQWSGLRIERSHADPNVEPDWVRVTDTQGTVYEFGQPADMPSPMRASDYATAMVGQYNCGAHHVGLENVALCRTTSQHELRTKLLHFGRNRLQAMYPWTLMRWVGNDLKPYRLLLARRTDRLGNQVHYFYQHEAARSGYGLNAPYQVHARLSRVVWAAEPSEMAQALQRIRDLQASAGAETTSGIAAAPRVFRVPDCSAGRPTFTLSTDPDTWRPMTSSSTTAPHTYEAGDGDLSTQLTGYCSTYPSQQGTPVTEQLDSVQAALDAVAPRLEVRFSYVPRRDGVEPNLQPTYGTHSFTTKALQSIRVVRVTPQNQPVTLHRYVLERQGGIAAGGSLLRYSLRSDGEPRDDHEYKITRLDQIDYPVVDEKQNRDRRTQWGQLERITHYVGDSDAALPPMELTYHAVDEGAPEPARGLLATVKNGYGAEQRFDYASVTGARDDTGLSSDAKKSVKTQYASVVTHVRSVDSVLGTESEVRFQRTATWAEGVVQNQWGGSRVVMTEVRQKGQGATDLRLESCTEQRFYTNLVHVGQDDARGYRFALEGLSGGDRPSVYRSGLVAGMGAQGFEKSLGGMSYETVEWKRSSEATCPAVAPHYQPTVVGQGAYQANRTLVDLIKLGDGDDDSYQVRPIDSYDFSFSPHQADVSQSAAWTKHTHTDFDAYMNPTAMQSWVRGPAESAENLVASTTHQYQPVIAGDGTQEHNLIHLRISTRTQSQPDGVVRASGTTTYWKKNDRYTALVETETRDALAATDSGAYHAECVGRPESTVVSHRYDDLGQPIASRTTVGTATVSSSGAEYHDVESGLWGLPASTTSSQGTLSTTSEMGYDAQLRPVTTKGPFHAGASVSIPGSTTAYDSYGRVISSTDALTGGSTQYEYLAPGTAPTLCAGKPDPYQSSAWRTCSCSVFSSGLKRCSLQAHSGTGAPFWSVDAQGYQSLSRYDGLGRVVQASSAYTSSPLRYTRTEYAPHAPGGASSVTWRPDGTWSQACPAVGSLLASETRAGASTSLPSCANHVNPTETLRVQRQELDARGRLVLSVDYLSATPVTTSFAYNDAGHLLEVSDALNRVRTYRYDQSGRRLFSSDPDAGDKHFCYDAQGRNHQASTAESRASVTSGMGWIHSNYDSAGRPASSSAPGGIASSYTYLDQTPNALLYGKLASASTTDAQGFRATHAVAYDALGRTERDSLTQDGRTLDVRHAYDPVTNALRCRDYPKATAQGPSTAERFSLRYQYDAGTGRLRSLSSAECACSTSCATQSILPESFQALHPDGSLASVTYADGSTDLLTRNMESGRLTNRSHLWRGWPLRQASVSYDALGQMSAQTERLLQIPVVNHDLAQASYVDHVHAYQYDTLGRLAQYTTGGIQQPFGYDALGNRTSGTGADYASALSMVAGTGLVATRTRADSLAQLQYDAMGRVTVMQELSGPSTTDPSLFERKRFFGPTGLSKLSLHIASTPSPESKVLTFAPHGLELEESTGVFIQRIQIAAPTASITLEWVNGQAHSPASFPSATGCGMPSCQYLPIVGNGQAPQVGATDVSSAQVVGVTGVEPALRSIAHQSHLGSVSLLTGISRSPFEPLSTDASLALQPNRPPTPASWLQSLAVEHQPDAHTSLRPSHAPFGEPLNQDASSPILLSDFAGHRSREASPLVDMGARIYDPSLGRFLQPDPVIADPALSQDYNAYAYVRNNPTHLTDPTGMWPELPNLGDWWSGLTSAVGGAYEGAMSAMFGPPKPYRPDIQMGTFLTQSIASVGRLGWHSFIAPPQGLGPTQWASSDDYSDAQLWGDYNAALNLGAMAYSVAEGGVMGARTIGAARQYRQVGVKNASAPAQTASASTLDGKAGARIASSLTEEDLSRVITQITDERDLIIVAEQVATRGSPGWCVPHACTLMHALRDPAAAASPAPFARGFWYKSEVKTNFPQAKVLDYPAGVSATKAAAYAQEGGNGTIVGVSLQMIERSRQRDVTGHAAVMYQLGDTTWFLDPSFRVYTPVQSNALSLYGDYRRFHIPRIRDLTVVPR